MELKKVKRKIVCIRDRRHKSNLFVDEHFKESCFLISYAYVRVAFFILFNESFNQPPNNAK